MGDQRLRLEYTAGHQVEHLDQLGIDVVKREAGAGDRGDVRHLDTLPVQRNGDRASIEAAHDDDPAAAPDQPCGERQCVAHRLAARAFDYDIGAPIVGLAEFLAPPVTRRRHASTIQRPVRRATRTCQQRPVAARNACCTCAACCAKSG